jgi:hypothetical protein
MSSKALINVVTAVAMVEAFVSSMKEKGQSKTAEDLSARVILATQTAMKAWPGAIDQKGMKAMAIRIGRFEAIYGGEKDATLYTSIGLAVINDILRRVQDRERRSYLKAVEVALFRVHRYYDRSLKKTEQYEDASKAVSLWHSLGAE